MKITQKGQVTIPLDIREKYKFLPDTKIEFIEENSRVYIVKTRPDMVRENAFDYARGKSSVVMSTEEIMKLTRDDK